MSIKITTPNNGEDALTFGSATTATAAEVTGSEVSSGEGKLELKTTTGGTSATKVTIAADGKVGIGTTAPAVDLNVSKSADGVAARFQRTSGGGLVDIETYNGIGGIGTSDNIPFRLNTNNTERVRIDIGGNVGIGAAETSLFNGAGTSAKLVVTGSNSNTNILQNGDAAIAIVNTDQTDENTAGLHFARADTDNTPNYAGASIVAQFKETQVTGQYPSATMNFLTSTAVNSAPTTKMTLTEAGNVGIGTTGPQAKLDIRDDIAESSAYTGQLAINSVTKSTGNLARMMFSHDDHGSASIASNYESAGYGNLIFSTRGGGNPTERMRIAGAGNLEITSPASTTGLQPFTIDWMNENNAGIMASIGCDRTASSAAPADLVFRTSTSVDSGAISEKMRVTSTGDLKFNSGYGSAATAYGCRAWINLNGQGTIAIRGSANVSSVTDVAVGNYRVNFTNNMPDVNYCSAGTAGGAGADQINVSQNSSTEVPAVGSCRYTTAYVNGSAWDAHNICIAIFR